MSYRLGVSLIALTLASSSASATKITGVDVPFIMGFEDLNDLSTRIIRVESVAENLRKGVDSENLPPVVESYSLGRATKSALDEAQWMEKEVLKSPALVLPVDFNYHKKGRFDQKMREAYPEFKWDEYDRFLKNDLSRLFYNLQEHVAKNQFSNNWKKTNVEKVMVSFGRNTKGDLIVYLDPLKIGLPVYKDQRLADKDAFTPVNVKLSKSQQDSLNFLLHVMCNDPSKLMQMVSYRSYHPEEPLADSQYFFTHGKQRALELPVAVIDKDRIFLQFLIEKWQESEVNNPNPLRILDYIRNTKNSPLLIKYPDFAWELGEKMVVRRKTEIKKAEDERSFLRGLIHTWQDGERDNPNPLRILDYIRNTKNSPLLVKYPALSLEVGHQLVVKRKADITNDTADKERFLLQTLIYTWQEGEKTNLNPARILDYIRNTKNSYFLVKYGNFALDVGQRIVGRRKEELGIKD
jgi:hypothetical protein